MTRRVLSGLLTAVSLIVAAACPVAHAQCTGQWLPGEGVPGVNGTVKAAIMWDRDGAGPQPPVLVVGGAFTLAGTTITRNIAVWDGQAWSALGPGLGTAATELVTSLAVLPNGELVAAGGFALAGTTTVNSIARWNGTAWTALGTGVGVTRVTALPYINAVAATPLGDVIVVGAFTTAGGSAANHIARWNTATSSWSPLVASNGSGANGFAALSDQLHALLVLPDGDILVGGKFTTVSGISGTTRIARWTPASSSWSAMASGLAKDVYSLALAPNGDIMAGTVGFLQRWTGQDWEIIGGPIDGDMAGPIRTFATLPNGDIVIGGGFGIADNSCYLCKFTTARWNGVNWTRFTVTEPSSRKLRDTHAMVIMPNGQLAVGSQSNFDSTDGWNHIYPDDSAPNGISSWDGGANWGFIAGPGGTSGPVNAVTVEPNGDILAAGEFVRIEGAFARRVARLGGGGWSALGDGPGTSVAPPGMNLIDRLPNGEVIVSGSFYTLNQTLDPTNQQGRFDGTTWSPFMPVMNKPTLYGAVHLPGGDLVLAGAFDGVADVLGANQIVRWDGASGWSALGDGLASYVRAVALMPNGDIIAGGSYILQPEGGPTYTLARFNGTSWSGLTIPDKYVYSLLALPDGDLIVGGEFTTVAGVPGTKRIARCRPSTGQWFAMGSGLNNIPSCIVRMPNGDIVAAYGSVNGSPAFPQGLARWNGTSWTELGGGIDDAIQSLVVTPDGLLVAGGKFVHVGGQVSAYVARWADCVGVCCAADGSCTVARPGSPTAHCPSGTLVVSGTCSPNACSSSSTEHCCRGTTCNSVTAGTCTGTVSGSASIVVGSCGTGTATASCCYADFNHDGTPSIDDLFLYLNAYFTGSPWANVGGDGVAAPTIDDLFLYINAYFTGCV